MSGPLHLVLGDQLDLGSAFFDEVQPDEPVLLLELHDEATFVTQHQHRLVLFFAAMRHFRDALRERGQRVEYAAVDDELNRGSFREELPRWLGKLRPEVVRVREPGDWRVREALEDACAERDVELEIVADDHFLCSTAAFGEWRAGRKAMILEHFQRHLRKRFDILMDDGEPAGGEWNFDARNRASFGKGGAPDYPSPPRHRADAITRDVIALVKERYGDHPGDAENFALPVTRDEALYDLRAFVADRLPTFGQHQDAMVTGRPFLSHSRLSTALNLQLLHPREVVEAAEAAYRSGDAPIASVEGFVRQVLGWREFVRGVYMTEMPEYAERNALRAEGSLPRSYWTGETEMACVRDAMAGVLEHAYAHHIQRLMVLGLYAMLLGVRPYEVHEWHLAMYADAIDWVSLPNVLGMSQYGDDGLVGTKPYAASGNYVSKMSDYCGQCRFRPKEALGDDACPLTTLYWDFLSRNRRKLAGIRRMQMQLKNLDRKSDADRRAIRERAKSLRESPP
ncbi:MAG: cryptochrome/photolyase family protein [Sandaracinus sp.]|nr:cryptochrome/photolyase family protein [Sandaracinus sp.]|tara:strand:+ start:228 stop:1757 length:1530 start_codon:yes stop_codon:yes gene_type:complete